MTQQEIKDYNRRCALFLGAIYSEHAETWAFGNAKNIGSKVFHGIMYNNVIQAERFEKELKFHSDWNWIMEVVEAIEKLKFRFEFAFNEIDLYCVKGDEKRYSYAINIPDFEDYGKDKHLTKKEAVIQAINQFLIWYNENK